MQDGIMKKRGGLERTEEKEKGKTEQRGLEKIVRRRRRRKRRRRGRRRRRRRRGSSALQDGIHISGEIYTYHLNMMRGDGDREDGGERGAVKVNVEAEGKSGSGSEGEGR